MNVTKTFVVLANSYKHDPGHCVAGREITFAPDGSIRPGNWIRPVSSHAMGELWPEEHRLENGDSASVLDMVEVSLRSMQNEPTQPENWFIAEGRLWSRFGSIEVDDLSRFAENPADLWLEPLGHTDRVSEQYLAAHLPHQSLYLLQLDEFRVRRRFTANRTQFRLQFAYSSHDYDLSITDPIFVDELPPRFMGRSELLLKYGFICVSLAPLFNGHHYKVAATVIQPLRRRTVFTIGHASRSFSEFAGLLHQHGIGAVADVRSQPFSSRFPQFSRRELQKSLQEEGIQYVFLGRELGARRIEPDVYVERQAIYDLIAQTDAFRSGLQRVINGSSKLSVALMCAERDPLTCHRAILISRELQGFGLDIIHILDDGEVENHQSAERRLMSEEGINPNQPSLFNMELDDVAPLDRAYDTRGRRIAFRRGETPDESADNWIHPEER